LQAGQVERGSWATSSKWPSASEGTQNLGYDRLDRLNQVRDQNAALIEAFTYDATGNRLSHSVAFPASSTPTVTSYTYPAFLQNAFVSTTETQGFTLGW
jgi:hypothetical protein